MERHYKAPGSHMTTAGNVLAVAAILILVGVGGAMAFLTTKHFELVGAVMQLARHGLRLTPPLAWPVMGVVVVSWVALLRREWRDAG